MCLTIPAKVISLGADNKATVVFGNEKASPRMVGLGPKEVDTQLVKVKAGDYVMVSNGFAIKKVNKKEAEDILKLFKKL